MSNDNSDSKLSRRSAVKIGGLAFAGLWSRKELSAAPSFQTAAPAGGKPVVLAPENADLAAYSQAENLFWCDVMMEHAWFFAFLMPGPELADARGQAENFQRTFQAQHERAKSATLDKSTYASFNRFTVELLKPFIDFKRRMLDAQSSGKLRSLVFPLFFDHTAREAERAVARLDKLTAGDPNFNYSELVDFWSAAMSDHSEFIAHFLDPEEQDLISQALDSSAVFKGFNQGNKDHTLRGGDVVLATEELIDFETTIADGINAGRIKSILHPALADHMRRETLKFMDEFKRTVKT